MYMTLALSIDLGQTANYSVEKNASNSRIIGVINDCKKQVNPPIYLKSRPNNNSISVKILETNGIVSTTTYDYVLNLHLEKIK